MKSLAVNEGIVVYDIRWETDTAGPSPDQNKRVELFLLGCQKAMDGNPCQGCFNSSTWDIKKAEFSRDPIEIADKIAEMTESRYITIGGGEPTDQAKHLIPLCKRLKEHGFHIMMYTWKELKHMMQRRPVYILSDEDRKRHMSYIGMRNIHNLLMHIDILVDGEFKQEECLYQENLGDGMLSSIGSGNQRIYDIKHYRETSINKPGELLYYPMRELVGLYVKPDTNDLVYITKE